MARARTVSCAAVGRGGADCSSHCSTAVFVVSHVRPTLRPGRSPRCRRSYTVSAETVSNCAVRWTSSRSGQRPAAGAARGGRGGAGGASTPPRRGRARQGSRWWHSILQARDRVAIGGRAEQKWLQLTPAKPYYTHNNPEYSRSLKG